jgi:hypothetical protein
MTDSPAIERGAGGPAAPADPAAWPRVYPALLDALHETTAPGRLVASAAGYVLASREALPAAPEHGIARFGAAWTSAAGASGARIGTDPEALERFGRGLLDLHCVLLREALRHTMRWLDGRSAEGSSLLARQLNQGACADVAVEIAECEAMIARLDPAAPDISALISRRLTVAGRDLLDLLGAAGFLGDGPGGDLYLAELARNIYLQQGAERNDAYADHH